MMMSLAACGSSAADSTPAASESTASSEAASGEAAPAESEAAADFDTDQDITVISREDGSGTRGAFIELTGVEERRRPEGRQHHRGRCHPVQHQRRHDCRRQR